MMASLFTGNFIFVRKCGTAPSSSVVSIVSPGGLVTLLTIKTLTRNMVTATINPKKTKKKTTNVIRIAAVHPKDLTVSKIG
jgi:hypothetical protein